MKKLPKNLIRCYESENGYQHIHVDATSGLTGKQFSRYLKESYHVTFAVEKETHKDVEWYREKRWNFQWELLKKDVKRYLNLQHVQYVIAYGISYALLVLLHTPLEKMWPLFSLAIAVDATSKDVRAAGLSSPHTWSHTSTGTNLIHFTGLFHNDVSDAVSAVSLNSVSHSKIASEGTCPYISLWDLVNPTTGAQTVSASYSGTGKDVAHAVSYTGAAQTGQPDASNTNGATNQGNGTELAGTPTVIASNCWLVGVGRENQGGCIAGTSTTLRAQNAAEDGCILVDSNTTVGTGSQSIAIKNNSGGNADMNIIVASFAPFIAATAAPYTSRMLRGIGS